MPFTLEEFVFYTEVIGAFIGLLVLQQLFKVEKKARPEITNEVKNIVFQLRRK